MARQKYAQVILEKSPPWLRARISGKVMAAFGDVLDKVVEDTASGVRLRFPTDDVDADALAITGRERRIRRGPGESASSYARRLRTWWDAHRTRGGPYALLGQLYAFFVDTLAVRMDVVYQSGTRRWIDSAGVITRDSISWSGGSRNPLSQTPSDFGWSHVFVFFYLTGFPATVVTDTGAIIVTDGGASIIADVLTGGSLTPAEEEEFRAIPREWSTAHVPYVTVILLYGGFRLWGYPKPVPKWGDGSKWQSSNPIHLIAE